MIRYKVAKKCKQKIVPIDELVLKFVSTTINFEENMEKTKKYYNVYLTVTVSKLIYSIICFIRNANLIPFLVKIIALHRKLMRMGKWNNFVTIYHPFMERY